MEYFFSVRCPFCGRINQAHVLADATKAGSHTFQCCGHDLGFSVRRVVQGVAA